MDTARQILRFSIPGAVLILHATACYAIARRIQGIPPSEALSVIKDSIAGLVAATIPIGFLIYQVYFFNYRPLVRYWPLRWRGRFVRRDRAGEVFAKIEPSQRQTLERIFAKTIRTEDAYRQTLRPKGWKKLLPNHWTRHFFHFLELPAEGKLTQGEREKREASYKQRWSENWDVLRGTLEIAETVSGTAQFKSEYTSLSDIFHSLGAARSAVAGAWLLVVVILVADSTDFTADLLDSAIGLIVITLVTSALWYVLHTARRHTWNSASAMLALGLRWLFWKHPSGFDPGGARRSPDPVTVKLVQ